MKIKFISDSKYAWPHGLNKFFTKKFIMKNPSVIPIIGVFGFATVLTGAFVVYFCFSKDFRFNKTRPHQHELMDLLHPWKLHLIMHNKIKPLPDLHDVFQKMKAEERRRKRDECTD